MPESDAPVTFGIEPHHHLAIDHKMSQKTQGTMRDDDQIKRLCDQVREAAFALHSYLRHGHLEKVYENGLANRLRKMGLKVEQ